MLQSFISTLPFHLAVSTSTFLLYLINKYIIRAKEVRYISFKIVLYSLIPYLNIAFLVLNLLTFSLNYRMYRCKRNYTMRFAKYSKTR